MKLRIAALLAGISLTACTESALNPDDPVKVKGTALNEDKTPMANVELALSRSANNICLFMESIASLKTGTDGTFTHDLTGKDTQQTSNDLARCFVLSLPARADGAYANHDFFIQVTDVTIPPLQLWTGTVAVTQTNDGASITYKSLADTHDGLAPTSYRLEVTTEESPLHNSWWAMAIAPSPVVLSDYVLEDLALQGQLKARTEKKGSGTTFHNDHASSKVSVTGHAKRPVSRGATCSFSLNDPCKLTDGLAESQLAKDGTVEARITMPAAKILKKAVFRGFGVSADFKQIVIEGSADGATFTVLATVTDPEKIKSQFYEVDLTGTTAVSLVRIKGVNQQDQALRLSSAREISLFE